MKKVIVKNKQGIQTHAAEMDDPSQWIADCVAGDVWGLPERIVDDIEGSYDPDDVIEHIDIIITPAIEPVLVAEAVSAVLDEQGNVITPEVPAVYTEAVPAIIQKQVKLKAECTVEIIDISAEHALQDCINKRKSEYPNIEDFLNAYFDEGEQGIDSLREQRIAIKAKYPKPVKE